MAPSRADIYSFEACYHFDHKYTYPKDVVQDIDSARHLATTRGTLFFDRMLATIGVDGSTLYPPRDNKDLRKLHGLIVNSQASEHLKQSLIYYLLKDVKIKSKVDVAAQFAGDVFLSNKYWTFIDGLWAMDRSRWNDAMEFLTQPFLIPTFPEEILASLIDKRQDDLAFAYYNTVTPPITNNNLLLSYFDLLSRATPTEAFYFSRLQPDSQRRKLFEKLIDNAMYAGHADRANRGVELIDLPFDEDEEVWFEEYLTVGEQRKHGHAADVLLMRKIAKGRFREAATDVKTKEVSKNNYKDVRWDNVIDGMSKGMGPRDVDDIYEQD